MLELSLHILDVVENGLSAGAGLIEIGLIKDEATDRLGITITDHGSGIPAEILPLVTNPFFTTRTTRRVGLGLPLLKQAAEQADGCFGITSDPGRGTTVRTEFRLSHLDRAPLGDMAGTLLTLIVGRPEVDFVYRQVTRRQAPGAGPADPEDSSSGGPLENENEFILDTREIKEALDGVPLSDPEVIDFLRRSIGDGLAELGPV